MAAAEEVEELIIDIPLGPPDSKDSIYSKWENCSIYRVPKKLRSVKEKAYTPQLVSIGPFHHGRPELEPMEVVKSRYLDQFCLRTNHTRDDFRRLIDEDCEKEIKDCYAGTFQIKIDFAEMIITDAAFVIELMKRTEEKPKNDYICNKPWLAKSLELDLILLENQLPFFLLEKIYNFAFPKTQESHGRSKTEIEQGKDNPSAFLKLAIDVFSQRKHEHEDPKSMKGVLHFTDLLRYYYCKPSNDQGDEPKSDNRMQNLRSATKLDEAGINFEAVQDTYLKKIEFRKANLLRYCPCLNCSWLLKFLPCITLLKCAEPTLLLPQLEVDDTTESKFRNLMAFEQCHYPNQVYICNYVWLMDKLINTKEDVELLIDKKVVVNYLGSSKAVAEVFNSLCKQIVEHRSRYHQCVLDIVDHCSNPLNRIMATLTSVYFRDFWRGTATIVGILLLVLTVWSFTRRLLI